MKRMIALLLVAGFVTVTIGCGGATTSSKGTTSSTEVKKTETK